MNWRPCQYLFQRHKTRDVIVGDPANGGVIIGSEHPIVRQSMTTCKTGDTDACVTQILALAKAGCQIVRLTAPTVDEAANLRNIAARVRALGCNAPLVADIHFKPEAALEAALWVEMVRINPGNYADKKKFASRDYTDSEYAAELVRVEEQFAPLVARCKELNRAMRIGANHGSLSDRIMNRYGDTPLGMVESVLEFARIARKYDYHNFKFSLKSSNPKVMIACYRLLAARLEELGPDWGYPMHLGVTEAGEGEDGRIKSAIGIGSLLCDGIGDTIRVSLAEDSTREIEVCDDLIDQVPILAAQPSRFPAALKAEFETAAPPFDPFSYRRRETDAVMFDSGIKCGGAETVRVIVTRDAAGRLGLASGSGDDLKPDAVLEDLKIHEVDPSTEFAAPGHAALVTVKDNIDLPPIAAFRLLAARLRRLGCRNPILLKDCLARPSEPLAPKIALLRSSMVIGSLLSDGIGDAVLARNESDPAAGLRLAFNILQASGCRSFKADYVVCPSCGRTLFDLQAVTARIKERTRHLKGVKIAIMGCIVNGPGEMADADFGYVGGAPGKVNLYVGKTAVKFNIPEDGAVDSLIDLIREHGRWTDAPAV